jgi:hypothetical protein
MNPIDDQLNRLFRGAAEARSAFDEAALPLPFGLETRILAAWRESHGAPVGVWNTALLMRGLILACVLMALSFWPALSSTSTSSTDPVSDFLQLTDSTASSDSTP